MDSAGGKSLNPFSIRSAFKPDAVLEVGDRMGLNPFSIRSAFKPQRPTAMSHSSHSLNPFSIRSAFKPPRPRKPLGFSRLRPRLPKFRRMLQVRFARFHLIPNLLHSTVRSQITTDRPGRPVPAILPSRGRRAGFREALGAPGGGWTRPKQPRRPPIRSSSRGRGRLASQHCEP